jgi:hypothetical protein
MLDWSMKKPPLVHTKEVTFLTRPYVCRSATSRHSAAPPCPEWQVGEGECPALDAARKMFVRMKLVKKRGALAFVAARTLRHQTLSPKVNEVSAPPGPGRRGERRMAGFR